MVVPRLTVAVVVDPTSASLSRKVNAREAILADSLTRVATVTGVEMVRVTTLAAVDPLCASHFRRVNAKEDPVAVSVTKLITRTVVLLETFPPPARLVCATHSREESAIAVIVAASATVRLPADLLAAPQAFATSSKLANVRGVILADTATT
jgi:hypothetical protein